MRGVKVLIGCKKKNHYKDKSGPATSCSAAVIYVSMLAECIIRVISVETPITDVSLCSDHSSSRKNGSKFYHPRLYLKGSDGEFLLYDKDTILSQVNTAAAHSHWFQSPNVKQKAGRQGSWTQVTSPVMPSDILQTSRVCFFPKQTDGLTFTFGQPSGVEEGSRCSSTILGHTPSGTIVKEKFLEKWVKVEKQVLFKKGLILLIAVKHLCIFSFKNKLFSYKTVPPQPPAANMVQLKERLLLWDDQVTLMLK